MAEQHSDDPEIVFQLKPISLEGIPAAIEKAERYRLLNEPREAESICRDILAVDPRSKKAIICLILSMTDQFGKGRSIGVEEVRKELARLDDEYERLYYSGIICERQAGMHLAHPSPGCGTVAYEWLRDAMEFYESAERIRPKGNDDAILRWNTCARHIMRRRDLRHAPPDEFRPLLE